jgi:hypothetical protein
VLSVEPGQVTETARFKEDLDADSLDLVELVMGLEERFDISVPEEDLGTWPRSASARPRAEQSRRRRHGRLDQDAAVGPRSSSPARRQDPRRQRRCTSF